MSVVTRCGAVSLVLALLVSATPAFAESATGETSASSWTDPPVRGSAAPESPAAVRPAESKPDVRPPAAVEKIAPDGAVKSASAPLPTPAERAAAKLGVKPVEASQRAASAFSTRERRSVVRPRMVERPLVVARRPGRVVERPSRLLAQRSSRRTTRTYAFSAEPYSYGQVDTYDGRNAASTWSSRRLAGWGGLIDDNRAARIARARESGYAVMRMQTYTYPDGTRVQRLIPYDGGGFGDLD